MRKIKALAVFLVISGIWVILGREIGKDTNSLMATVIMSFVGTTMALWMAITIVQGHPDK